MIAVQRWKTIGNEEANKIVGCALEALRRAVDRHPSCRYRRSLVALALLLTPIAALAVPASPVLVELKQPDGTRFEARQWGDEWLHGWETADGFSIVRDQRFGFWTFAARAESGSLVATDLWVGHDSPPAALARH